MKVRVSYHKRCDSDFEIGSALAAVLGDNLDPKTFNNSLETRDLERLQGLREMTMSQNELRFLNYLIHTIAQEDNRIYLEPVHDDQQTI